MFHQHVYCLMRQGPNPLTNNLQKIIFGKLMVNKGGRVSKSLHKINILSDMRAHTIPENKYSGSFQDFVQLCEDITDEQKHTHKTQILIEFLARFKGDWYLLFKLLLPKHDHRVFRLKDRMLIKIMSSIFGDNQQEMLDHLDHGDVSDTCKQYLEQSGSVSPKSFVTLRQVDLFLDSLTTLRKQSDQIAAFEDFVIGKLTGDDIKYIVRLIAKDLKLRAGTKYLLLALHPNAHDIFLLTNNIEDVLDRVMSGNELTIDDNPKKEKRVVRNGGRANAEILNANIVLFKPIKPMLARASKSFDDVVARCPNGFYMEQKYDGERIQIHYNRKKNQLACYSRNLKPILEHKLAEVGSFIPSSITKSVSEVILDGEILLIDNITNEPLPFGTLGKHKRKQFEDATVCIFVFDILYRNGVSLIDLPFGQRRKLLVENVKPIPNRIQLAESILCDGPESKRKELVMNKMKLVVQKRQEGLVIKDLLSTYEPNARHWLKMKKDYLQGMADSADLIVLGAYFGTGRNGGIMSVFLMGCYDKNSKKYKTVCKCGNGHNEETIANLNLQLKSQMTKISKDYSRIPKWLDVSRSMVPDFVIKDPKTSPVWEISGSEFLNTSQHTSTISIRFPRVTRIRDDKNSNQATSLAELTELAL